MEMSGEYRIAAPRAKVWAALNDPEILKASIPGCQELEKRSDTEMAARVVTKIGPVKATFNGEVTLSNINPPSGYTITGEGKGGVAGFAKGGATVALTDKDGGTLLTYNVEAQIGGKLAQLGQRLINSAAKKTADDFFANFAKAVQQG
jgi:carbon monoxide dehydrogenase subunit G